MDHIVAFDLDGTLAESKRPLTTLMAQALQALLTVTDVAVISGGDWPQFDKQVASRLPCGARVDRLWLLPATGTKLYVHREGRWTALYADLFEEHERASIIAAFHAALAATGLGPDRTWGPQIEDRGSQITFSALGQLAPLGAKECWDPDFAKRKVLQADLRARLPHLSINIGGTTSIDITRGGVDKGFGLRRLSETSGVPLEGITFVGDAIFAGGNDYPARQLGLHCIPVGGPRDTLVVMESLIERYSREPDRGQKYRDSFTETASKMSLPLR